MTATVAAPVRSNRRSRSAVLDASLIFVLAFVLRFGLVALSRGGIGGYFGYDAGVYYSAADALTFGRVPYSDFIFLHPPGLIVFLAPFAALGRLTTDHTGYVVANTFFNLLSAGTAVLVWQTVRRWGGGRWPAMAGGLFYAIWWGAISAETGVRLEPLGSFVFAVGMLLLAGVQRNGRDQAVGSVEGSGGPAPAGGSAGRGAAILAGVAFGAACCVKIWWTAPLLVVLAWHLSRARRRTGGYLLLGAVAAIVVIDGPFFAMAPSAMWHRVVTDQLGRSVQGNPLQRLEYLAGEHRGLSGAPHSVLGLALVIIAVVFVATLVVAWRFRPARLAVTVAVVQFLVLMGSPSFFSFYSGYIGVPLALTVAAAAAARRATPSPATATARPEGRAAGLVQRLVAVAALVVAAVMSASALANSHNLVAAFPGKTFERATAGLHCVMTDSNSALILMNRLSTDLRHGCPNWIDVTGHTYFGPAKSRSVPRAGNLVWQAYLRRYLLSGDAVTAVRAGTGLSRATKRIIASHPVLARGDGFVLHAVPRPGR